MKMNRAVLAASLGLVAFGAPLAAQQAKASPGAAAEGKQPQRNRAELEKRVRENLAAELKKHLQLTDDQMTRVMAVNQRLDAQRRELFQQERAARVALRTELAEPEASANQTRVGELLETLLRLQRNRLDLVEREQRELAAFLTPVQRAKYQAFADFMQRRLDDMADGRGRGDGRRGGQPGTQGQGRGGSRPPATPPPVR